MTNAEALFNNSLPSSTETRRLVRTDSPGRPGTSTLTQLSLCKWKAACFSIYAPKVVASTGIPAAVLYFNVSTQFNVNVTHLAPVNVRHIALLFIFPARAQQRRLCASSLSVLWRKLPLWKTRRPKLSNACFFSTWLVSNILLHNTVWPCLFLICRARNKTLGSKVFI